MWLVFIQLLVALFIIYAAARVFFKKAPQRPPTPPVKNSRCCTGKYTNSEIREQMLLLMKEALEKEAITLEQYQEVSANVKNAPPIEPILFAQSSTVETNN